MTKVHYRKIIAGSLAYLALLGPGTPARADHIDTELFVKGGLIMKDLEAHGYKNVGVLKFQVKKGNAAPTMTAGKLNYLMATRLENALIMKDRPDALIGITRGASASAAAQDGKATYLTPEGRKNLLRHKYPLAWGNQIVEVDAFLTGTVEIAPDMRKTKITIQAFDKQNPALRDVLSFTVDTDIAILRDTNQNFVVARRDLKILSGSDDPDEDLNKKAVQDAQKDATQGSRKLTMAEVKDYLDFQILFDGQPVDVSAEGFLEKPTAGQKVQIKLNAKVKLGLLLRVNGVNTLNEERDEKSDLNEYRWWVLDPNTEYLIRGFYVNDTVKTFVAKAQAEVDVGLELGERVERHGTIEFDVFVDPASVTKEKVAPKVRKTEYNFRSVKTRATTFAQLKTQVQKSMVVARKPVARTFLVGGDVENQTLETTTFDGRHVGGLVINYRRDLAETKDNP